MENTRPVSRESTTKRAQCERCARAVSICICEALPLERLALQTKILVVQHPLERHRKVIGTVPLLEACLTNFEILVSDPRGATSSPMDSEATGRASVCTAAEVITRRHTGACFLLYPCADAVDVESGLLPDAERSERTLIVIDGTWPQARQIFEREGLKDAVRAGTLRCIQV